MADTNNTLRGVAHRFAHFREQYSHFFRTKTRDGGLYAYQYLSGLLRMEKGRNFANIGRESGVAGQNMQHFMSNSPWSSQLVFVRVQQEIKAKPGQEAAANEPWVESVHARINPYGASMDGPPWKVVPVLKKIHDAGKGVVGMKIIGAGDFSNSDEMRNRSVRFALRLGCVDVLNVGFESHGQIDDLAARVRDVARVAV